MITVQATKIDATKQYALRAVAHLEAARYAREQYDRVLHLAIETYGDLAFGETHTSGVYNPRFPDPVKDQLRAYARQISEQTDYAVQAWTKGRRRIETLRPLLQYYRTLSDGRVSYY